MSDFMKPNAAVTAAVEKATTVEELREALHATLESQGVLTRDRLHLVVQPSQESTASGPAPSTSLPATSAELARCYRVVYPSGNNRFELYGDTEESLDAQETAIRAMYQR
jgi:hypothetical protein